MKRCCPVILPVPKTRKRNPGRTLNGKPWEVGGSIVRISRQDGRWRLVQDDRFNRAITAATRIPIISEDPVAGSREAVGTVGNCAGGVTPWQTLLTCEENFISSLGTSALIPASASTGRTNSALSAGSAISITRRNTTAGWWKWTRSRARQTSLRPWAALPMRARR